MKRKKKKKEGRGGWKAWAGPRAEKERRKVGTDRTEPSRRKR